VGLLGLLEANRQTHGSLLNLPQITVPHALEKVYANTERSGNPPPEPCAEPVIPEPDPEVVGTDTEGRN